MTKEKKYIYGIIKNPKAGEQDTGIIRFSAGIGLNGHDLNLALFKDLAAVTANTYLSGFDRLDKKELNRLVSAHEQINANLMKEHDLVPMRFGMIVESGEEILNVLKKAYIQFKMALERISGKVEFIIEGFWDKKKTLEKIVQENAEIQKLKKEVESKGKILGFSSKIKLGKCLFEASESRRKEYIRDILGELSSHFPNFSAGKLLKTVDNEASNGTIDSAQQQVAYGTGKEMIMNYSFLIDTARESALESILNQLAEKYKDDLKFKYIGPLPPYSFTAINLSSGNFDLIDSARKTLGLGESAALSEIKKRYYKLAAEYHPDKHEYKSARPLLKETAEKMKEIIRAKEILDTYCKHFFMSSPQQELFSFRKEDVENLVIVK